MLWYDMNGMVMVWYGMIWYATVFYGMLRYAMLCIEPRKVECLTKNRYTDSIK